MLKDYTHIILSFFLFGKLFADLPEDWTIVPANYENFMTITAILEIDNIPSLSGDIVLGAFVGEECRGYVEPISVGEQWMYFLMIYANGNNETVDFRVYDLEYSALTDVLESIPFNTGNSYGNPDDPVILSAIFDLDCAGIPNGDTELDECGVCGGDNSTCDDSCLDESLGDINNDGGYNVLDIVALANCILSGSCDTNGYGCTADVNEDGGYNVLDIVMLANCVLNGTCGDL